MHLPPGHAVGDHSRSGRNVGPSKDEQRLLGASSARDPEAVPIRIPGAQSLRNQMSATNHPGRIGGPRPTNTLSQYGANRAARAPAWGRNNQTLTFTPSVGSNVTKQQAFLVHDDEHPARLYKRQKLDPALGGLADFNSEKYSIQRADPSQKPVTPSTLPKQRIPNLDFGRTTEYNSVERMMQDERGKETKRKRSKHSDDRSGSSQSTVHPIRASASPSKADPIDLSSDKSEAEGKNFKPSPALDAADSSFLQEDDLIATSTIRPMDTRGTGKRSAHFPQKTRQSSSPEILLPKRSTAAKLEGAPASRDTNLRNKFVTTDGHRRSADFHNPNISSDELGAETTIGRHAKPLGSQATSLQKPSRSTSPFKQPTVSQYTGHVLDEGDGGLDASIIPASNFSKEGRKYQRTAGRSRPAKFIPNPKTPNEIRLKAVSSSGTLIEDDGLRLVYNNDKNLYAVHNKGIDLNTHDNNSLHINAKKVQKITWAESGKRARFESSKSRAFDNVLDIEFISEKDLSDTVREVADAANITPQRKPKLYSPGSEIVTYKLIEAIVIRWRKSLLNDLQSREPDRTLQAPHSKKRPVSNSSPQERRDEKMMHRATEILILEQTNSSQASDLKMQELRWPMRILPLRLNLTDLIREPLAVSYSITTILRKRSPQISKIF